MAGVGLEGRMEHARDLGPGREPARHVERLLLVLAQAQGHGAQAAQAEEDVLRARAHGEGVVGRAQGLEAALVGRDQAEQEVGAAAEIFGAGLDREVDAALVGREEQRRRPGVVHEDDRPAPVRDLGDGRDVLHLEGLRAGRLGEDGRRVRPEERLDAGADQRIVIGRLDPEALAAPRRRRSGSGGRPNPSPGDGRRPSGRTSAPG